MSDTGPRFVDQENDDSKSSVKVYTTEKPVIYGSVHPVNTIPADGDPAALYAADGELELTTEMDKRLRRKADLYIIPIVSVVYGLQFADKLIPSPAAMLGLTDELFAHSNTGFSWVGSSFYLGYLVFELPMSYLMQKMNLSVYCGIIIASWGTVLACTAACHNMESFLACRVLLGALECGIQPAFTLVVTQWYKKSELFSRTCLWYSANGMGGLFIMSVSYGLKIHSENNPNVYHMTPWRMIYIIMGLITILLGVCLWLLLPDDPHKARFLTEEEKRFQIERIRHNNHGFGSHHIKPYQIKDALTDPRTWLYGASQLLGTIPNGGLTVFSTMIISGMGYKGKDSLLMNLPPYATEFVGMFVISILSLYVLNGRRILYTLFGSALSVASLALVAWGPSSDTQLAGVNLYTLGGVVSSAGFVSMVESDSAGTTKKVTANSILLMSYCAGNMIGPQIFYKREAPEYATGKRGMAIAQCVQLGLICCLGVLNYAENKRRDRTGITEPPAEFVNAEFADLTDREMPWFRYTL